MLKIDGVYEHVKTGKRYRLLSVAKDVHTLEDFVVYEALYDNEVGKIWIRSKNEFLGEATSVDGTMHPRFILVKE